MREQFETWKKANWLGDPEPFAAWQAGHAAARAEIDALKAEHAELKAAHKRAMFAMQDDRAQRDEAVKLLREARVACDAAYWTGLDCIRYDLLERIDAYLAGGGK